MTFGPSAHGDTPPPLRHADVLNEWSLSVNVNVSPKAESLGHLLFYVKTLDDGTKVQSQYISTIEISELCCD